MDFVHAIGLATCQNELEKQLGRPVSRAEVEALSDGRQSALMKQAAMREATRTSRAGDNCQPDLASSLAVLAFLTALRQSRSNRLNSMIPR